MPEPNRRDISNEPSEVECVGLIRFHDSRYVSSTLVRPKELWDKAAGFWDEVPCKHYRSINADRGLNFMLQRS